MSAAVRPMYGRRSPKTRAVDGVGRTVFRPPTGYAAPWLV